MLGVAVHEVLERGRHGGRAGAGAERLPVGEEVLEPRRKLFEETGPPESLHGQP